MTFVDKVYTLRTEVRSDGKTSYFISFTDGQGKFSDLEVSEAFYMEFRQMERKNRNLQQSDRRHHEASELWDETMYERAFRVPKSVEELVLDAEQRAFLYKAISKLPQIQRRRFYSTMNMTSISGRLERWSIADSNQLENLCYWHGKS